MITAVSLNPAIDRTIELNGFRYGGMNRVLTQRDDAGGKAVNMAAVAASLGEMAEVVGVQYRENGAPLAEKLNRLYVGFDYILRDGPMRVNLKLLDTQKGIVTEINASGTSFHEKELESVTALILAHAQRSDYLVLTGSLPAGCPDSYYAEIIVRAHALGCRCVLDAEGAPLAEGIKARPELIKPNRMELETLLGREFSSTGEVLAAAKELVNRGVACVCVSLGSEGALITDGDKTYFSDPVVVPVGSTVGAGDAMVAGLITSMIRSPRLDLALRLGVACAAASVTTEGTEPAAKKIIDALYKQINVREV